MGNDSLKNRFQEQFGHECRLFFSPGRINLIGEHTDYNAGFVFPGAVDKGITLAIAPNGTSIVNVLAIDLEGQPTCSFDLENPQKPEQRWACYVFGACMEIAARGYACKGFDAAFTGDIPLGAGMSSSAAIDCVFAYALNVLFCKSEIDRLEIAKIGQAVENNWCGLNCGIMDQFASVFGKKGQLIRLDCRSLEYEYFPFNPVGYSLVLVDSCVKHMLGGEYNERRKSCETAVAAIAARWPQVRSLRDATHEMLDSVRSDISETDFQRASYILDEKERVLEVCGSLEKGDYENVGRCMYHTHWGMSRQYGASCPETDFLVGLASDCGVAGSRIMGGGFGGCTINLIKDGMLPAFIDMVKQEYKDRFSIEPKIYNVTIGDGTREISNK
ncbi:MAG: galactokinase [Bacteroidaceae bacterium]|nr:galactokinase [Bacteroidaceae bacterium]